MDLTKNFPRSPREKVGGIAMFPRTIDKARAKLAGTLGEYIYDCSMDRQLFETIGCDAEQFLSAVRVSSTDAEVLDLLVQARIPDDTLKAHNQRIDQWHPNTPEGWDHFKDDLKRIANNHPKVKSRTDLIDFEEGRLSGAK
ncbi:MAG: DUF5069 domain-containing protein [Candidatus Eremiobacteraeota bacterium]|nr:DUF5069 domain-containing protein [Candidatus Eremiobacteraeota bacterium]MBV8364992.1 DUF5069 domain-containing protein [Candidatus Eremiobacteraeota bacterium]